MLRSRMPNNILGKINSTCIITQDRDLLIAFKCDFFGLDWNLAQISTLNCKSGLLAVK